MKVLFWINIGLDRHSTSGHLLMAMMEQVKNLGNDVDVIHKNTGGDDPSLLRKMEKIGIRSITVPFVAAARGNFAKRYFTEVGYIRNSSKLIKDEYQAIFIQSNIAAGFSVKYAKKRCPSARIVYNVQDVYPQDVMYAGKISEGNPIFKGMMFVQTSAYRKADRIITISEDMKDLVVEAGADSNKVDVIYNWSYQDSLIGKDDVSPIITDMFDQRYFNVVYAGNIGLFQNVDIVVDVAERLKGNKQIWFHIFGSGLYKEKLETRAKESGISNITFHPIQPHELAPSIYASASINLIPLGKNQYRAALPSKTATCLACQRPIIFIIGKESKYGKVIMRETNCPVLDCDDVDGVVDSIIKIQNCEIITNTGDFFLENCSKTKNSMKYARIITGEE